MNCKALCLPDRWRDPKLGRTPDTRGLEDCGAVSGIEYALPTLHSQNVVSLTFPSFLPPPHPHLLPISPQFQFDPVMGSVDHKYGCIWENLKI